jgi:hypothetical protein
MRVSVAESFMSAMRSRARPESRGCLRLCRARNEANESLSHLSHDYGELLEGDRRIGALRIHGIALRERFLFTLDTALLNTRFVVNDTLLNGTAFEQTAALKRRHHDEVAQLRQDLAAAHGEILALRRRLGEQRR